jgi:hypothetical protein
MQTQRSYAARRGRSLGRRSHQTTHRCLICGNAVGAVEVDTAPRPLQSLLWQADVNDQPIRAWRELAADWKVWLSLALCLLIATVAWLLGYD